MGGDRSQKLLPWRGEYSSPGRSKPPAYGKINTLSETGLGDFLVSRAVAQLHSLPGSLFESGGGSLLASAEALAVLPKPVVLRRSAKAPPAVLLSPTVLLWSAFSPVAVFCPPVVLLRSALSPLAVLKLPVVNAWAAWAPTTVFCVPVRVKFPAFFPKNTLSVPSALMIGVPAI